MNRIEILQKLPLGCSAKRVALFPALELWADHGQLFPNLVREGLPTIQEVAWLQTLEANSRALS